MMIDSYSKKITPPYSGLVQIVESDEARAMSMDGIIWEFYFLHTRPADENGPERKYQRRYSPVAMIDGNEIINIAQQSELERQEMDQRVLDLILFVADAELPFPSVDKFEFWLLDAKDSSPLALIFSCSERYQMKEFPSRAGWTALPAAVMGIEKTEQELEEGVPPVNSRFESLIAERAGINPKVKWFERQETETDFFPSLLVKEDWQTDEQKDLCQRYLDRQSPRLMLLQNLHQDDRKRLEIAARKHVFETERFHTCYQECIDQKLMNTILIEARLRRGSSDESLVANRRDGIHYL